MGPSQQNVDRERLSVDIGALKQQYSKLRQRQKQAQIILTSESAIFDIFVVVVVLVFVAAASVALLMFQSLSLLSEKYAFGTSIYFLTVARS